MEEKNSNMTNATTTSSRLTLLLCPLSERDGGRVQAVLTALRRSGVQARLLDEVLELQQPYRWLSEGRVRWALRRAAQVVLLPRPDGAIGAGTLRDLRLAEAAELPIAVVRQDGRLLPLAKAGLVDEPKPTQVTAARFTWR